MNKILKATYSHYQAQRDHILSELDIVLNRSSKEGDTDRAIKLIKDLSDVNSCINTLDLIIQDNSSTISELDTLSKELSERLKSNDK
jgi:hypothetical protein